MRIVTPDQNSADWLREKCGIISASRMEAATSFYVKGDKKGAETKERHRYKRDLALERITSLTTPHFVSPDMDFGSAFESVAAVAYELAAGVELERVGFVLHPEYDFAGASPDRLVKDSRGMVEIKVPRLDTHLDWLEAGVVPPEHLAQCDFGLACTEYDWCDFVSYSPPVDDDSLHPNVRDPRRLVLPEDMHLFVVRVERDEKRIAKLDFAAVELNAEVDALVEKLRSRRNPLKEKLRKSVEEIDAELGITDADLPSWYREMAK